MVRIQFELPEDQAAALESLMQATAVRTKKELLNNALTLFEWAVNERRQGFKVASINEEEKKIRELLMPALQAVALGPATAVQTSAVRT